MEKVANVFAHLLEIFTVYLFVLVVALQSVWKILYEFFSNPVNTNIVFAATLTFIVLVMLYDRRRRVQRGVLSRGFMTRFNRGRTMSPEARAVYVKRVLAEAINDALMEAALDGKVTLDEIIAWSDKLADHGGLRELSSRRSEKVKAFIRKSLGNKGAPAPIPDTPSVVKPAKFRLGKIFGKTAA